jgi:hypothetical protein
MPGSDENIRQGWAFQLGVPGIFFSFGLLRCRSPLWIRRVTRVRGKEDCGSAGWRSLRRHQDSGPAGAVENLQLGPLRKASRWEEVYRSRKTKYTHQVNQRGLSCDSTLGRCGLRALPILSRSAVEWDGLRARRSTKHHQAQNGPFLYVLSYLTLYTSRAAYAGNWTAMTLTNPSKPALETPFRDTQPNSIFPSSFHVRPGISPPQTDTSLVPSPLLI